MAGTLTHFKFANDLYNRLQMKSLNKDFFIMGNQGHDLNYFLHLWEYPWHKKYFSYTKEMQRINLKVFAKNCKTDNNELKSFIYGYLAHEILDHKVHPYINNVTAYDGYDHGLLESVIDVKINDLDQLKKEIPHHLKLTKNFKQEFTRIFNNYFHKPHITKRMLHKINEVYPFLWLYRFDKWGIKRFFYRLLNKQELGYLAYHFTKEELDVSLNEFTPLYNAALLEAEKFIKNLDKKLY